VRGFGFIGSDLGQLIAEETNVVKEIKDRAPGFQQRLSLEKRFHRSSMAGVRKEKAIVRNHKYFPYLFI
jgi:hypothetical protein